MSRAVAAAPKRPNYRQKHRTLEATRFLSLYRADVIENCAQLTATCSTQLLPGSTGEGTKRSTAPPPIYSPSTVETMRAVLLLLLLVACVLVAHAYRPRFVAKIKTKVTYFLFFLSIASLFYSLSLLFLQFAIITYFSVKFPKRKCSITCTCCRIDPKFA